MPITKALVIAGLVLNTLGAYLMYRFGIPQKIDRQGHGHLLLGGVDENEKKRAKKYDRAANTGLILLIAGFALQLLGTLFS